jgi:geranylgeranyl diphosphate synthase, type II
MAQTPTDRASSAPPIDQALVASIEAELLAFLASAEMPGNLLAACRHAVLAGGKRVRPVLVIECARACGGADGEAMPAAVAIELVHAFSLVHDDLPALDNDTVRRGKPTCHVAFGEAMAILAGDNLLALSTVAAGRSPRSALEIQSALAVATARMINGQVYDTLREFPAGTHAATQLELVHRNKTGALIECACRMGGLAAGESGRRLDALVEYGQHLGLMFQIVDDLIDATQSAEHAGKATGKDEAAGKLTYPGVHGIDASRREVERLRHAAHGALSAAGLASGSLGTLVEYLAARTR